MTDKHVARLVKRTALAAGIRTDLSEAEREEKFSGHSLRAGLATSAAADERDVQKQLGHTSVEMTRTLPAPPRPVPRQSHQGSGAVICSKPLDGRWARKRREGPWAVR